MDDATRGLLITLWGSDAWYLSEEQLVVGVFLEDNPKHRSATVIENGKPVIYLDDPTNLPALAHECGHVIHARKYPESHSWPIWKAEAFALLADVRASRFLRTPILRQQFARHFKNVRKEGTPDHVKGLRLAYKAAKLQRLNEQEAFIASA